MNQVKKSHGKRKRGVGLSTSGLRRLNQAIRVVETEENQGKQFTAEQLSDRTGISTSTLSRLWTGKTGVDRRSLHLLFNAFNLDLWESDLQQVGEEAENTRLITEKESFPTTTQIRYPSGPVPIDSNLYVSRSGVDDRTFQEIQQPGCVIRIKAPSGFGKSSLVLRIIDYANLMGYATVAIDLQQADSETLANTHSFLQWFCKVISLKLKLDSNIDQYWDDLLGSKLSTTLFMRESILAQFDAPLVLIINEIERIFEYYDTAKNLLPLLRSWHEEAQQDPVWKKLRLVVAYSTDAYLPLDINQSPFNIGLPIPLPEFNLEEVESLASVYGAIDNDINECKSVLSLTGGNPSLVAIALYHLQQGMTLNELLESACTLKGIYHNPLQRMLAQINQNSQWIDCLKLLANGETAIAIDSILAYKLEGMGLINPSANGWQLSCELYRSFFQNYLFN
ncbi:AAA-like domain-containing protein [Floridanema aerugineum]|jgi:transcriptional regulator with XRE-family HTH domain|uniref:AAA-like domain-containing protein n=1 Tax=Floridaenema aerugineum BLCC-F46 TaxID=3153654 RepID=A0ABV4WXU2_9CYAN